MSQPRTPSRQFSVWILAFIYLATFLTILLLAYSGNLPGWLGSVPYYDKIGHVVLYAVASYLGHRVYCHRHLRLWNWQLPLFPGLFLVVTLAEEFIQHLSPNRTFDAVDLIASLAGILLGWQLAQRSC
ncbi:hypothetical protein C7271_08710 [filamentous cyanobacterium CCP5]|nr:hypothetical protein C7271_08710 [filamentous cyanobacterium CCP5]